MNNAYFTFISLVMLALITAGSTEKASAQTEGNAIPYPLPEWKGVQGKTLADSKPDFIGQPKAPKMRQMF
jgi:hypothetical protein